MAKKPAAKLNAQPHIHQRASEIQEYGTVSHALPLELEEPVRLEMTERLNHTTRRHHDPARSVQEISLAGRRSDFLSASSAFRQAFR